MTLDFIGIVNDARFRSTIEGYKLGSSTCRMGTNAADIVSVSNIYLELIFI